MADQDADRRDCSDRVSVQAFPSHCFVQFIMLLLILAHTNKKIVSEYDQEIPQSQTADKPLAPRVRAAQPSRNTRKTN